MKEELLSEYDNYRSKHGISRKRHQLGKLSYLQQKSSRFFRAGPERKKKVSKKQKATCCCDNYVIIVVLLLEFNIFFSILT